MNEYWIFFDDELDARGRIEGDTPYIALCNYLFSEGDEFECGKYTLFRDCEDEQTVFVVGKQFVPVIEQQ